VILAARTRLKPRTGFCAETGAAMAILFATHLGLPVSTTHAVAGSLVGVGIIQRVKAVREFASRPNCCKSFLTDYCQL
jgi:PiT family inorganic phosphate transporter